MREVNEPLISRGHQVQATSESRRRWKPGGQSRNSTVPALSSSTRVSVFVFSIDRHPNGRVADLFMHTLVLPRRTRQSSRHPLCWGKYFVVMPITTLTYTYTFRAPSFLPVITFINMSSFTPSPSTSTFNLDFIILDSCRYRYRLISRSSQAGRPEHRYPQ